MQAKQINKALQQRAQAGADDPLIHSPMAKNRANVRNLKHKVAEFRAERKKVKQLRLFEL